MLGIVLISVYQQRLNEKQFRRVRTWMKAGKQKTGTTMRLVSMGKNVDFVTQCLGSSLYICLVGPNILFSAHSMLWDLTLVPIRSAVGSPTNGYVVRRAILPNPYVESYIHFMYAKRRGGNWDSTKFWKTKKGIARKQKPQYNLILSQIYTHIKRTWFIGVIWCVLQDNSEKGKDAANFQLLKLTDIEVLSLKKECKCHFEFTDGLPDEQ